MRMPVYKGGKEDILKSTFKFLVKNGLENTSVRDLSKGTSLPMGSVYYWFQNKEELIINATEYGLSMVAEEIFSYVFKNITDFEKFFKNFLHDISKYKLELRFIYQVATSPVYGERMRKNALSLDAAYDGYALELSKILNCPPQIMNPVIYIFISTVLDYIIWEDEEKTKLQLDYIYSILNQYKS